MPSWFRFATRRLFRKPGFALGVTALLALGIGAGTALLSLVDAVSFRPLAVHRPGELVRVVQHNPAFRTTTEFPWEFFLALKTRSPDFSAIAGETNAQVVLTEPAPAQEIRVSFVTAQFFSLLGVPALRGRVLAPSDERDSSEAPPAVLSYLFWTSRFHRDPRVLGQSVVLNNHPFVIVGVMPRSFHGLSVDTTPDVRVPLGTRGFLMTESGGAAHPYISIVGRLKPGRSRAAAQAATLAIFQLATTQYWTDRMANDAQFARENLADDLRLGVQLESERRGNSLLRDRYGPGWILLGVSALILELLLCANLATIFLSRNAARTNDIAVRLALGASRGNVLRLLLFEDALLAAIGAISGIAVGYLFIPILVHLLPPMRDPGTNYLAAGIDVGHDARPLVIGFALAMGTFLGFGCAPAWITSRMPVREGLQSGHVSHRLGAQRRLLALQIAICTLLLACSGLFTRSFVELRGTNPGFDAEHLVSFTFDPQLRGYTDEQANRFRERLMAQVQALPGVRSVAVTRWPLMRGTGLKVVMAPQGVTVPDDAPLNVTLNPATGDFFATMGMRILEGRMFPQHQKYEPGKAADVVVNEAFARQLFPGVNPLGKRFGMRGHQSDYEVAGVVSDAKFRSLREAPLPIVYWDASYLGRWRSVLYMRTTLQPETLIQPVQKIFAALDPTLPVTDVATMEEELDATTADDRFNAQIASAFALFATILAGLGIYGLMGLIVTQRQRELAIHLAVGASRSRLVALVSRQFVIAVVAGIALGVGAALFAGPLLRRVLYGVTPSDPKLMLASAGGVVLLAFSASLPPLLRAVHIEPGNALRQTE
jgi:predicted permease